MDLLRALAQRLGAGKVHRPGDSAGLLATVAFHEVRDRRPAAVLRPASFDDVRAALRVLAEHRAPVTVLGGGHGPRCIQSGVVCLDLRSIPATAVHRGDEVRVNGSARVADLVAAVPDNRAVPVGVTGGPGMGLLITGGVGGLSRSLGLSIDSLRSVELLLADGRPVAVTPESPADLWWAVRGAAARLGVVRSATFATHQIGDVIETQILTRAGALAEWAVLAPAVPREATVSWTMTPAADGAEPLVLINEVAATDAVVGFAHRMVPESRRIQEQTRRHAYRDFADVNVPSGRLYGPPRLTDIRMRRIAPLLSAAGTPAVLADVVRHLRFAPTPWCRVELQHIGGAVGDVGEHETAFSGRGAEYCLVCTAAWPAGSPARLRAVDWVAELDDILAPARVARYLSEAEPGLPGVGARVAEGFGGQLGRMQELARRWDPDDRFRYAPPFTPEILGGS